MPLEMREACERCGAKLGQADEAFICSWECTFCCVCHAALAGVCPNCGGELLLRPRRGVKARPDAQRPSADSLSIPGFARTPRPPYYAVGFTSLRTEVDEGYGRTADRMVELASQQPGYLGLESVRENGLGITVSYWRSLDELRAWKAVEEHRRVQQKGRESWYRAYVTRVSRVAYDYAFEAGSPK